MMLYRMGLPHVISCKESKYLRKKSKVEIYTCRVRISFVGSKAELSRLCLWLLYIFFLSGKEIAITLQLIFARDAVRF